MTDLSETTWTLGDDAVLFTLALGITLQPWQIGVLCQVMGPRRTPAPSDQETP